MSETLSQKVNKSKNSNIHQKKKLQRKYAQYNTMMKYSYRHMYVSPYNLYMHVTRLEIHKQMFTVGTTTVECEVGDKGGGR